MTELTASDALAERLITGGSPRPSLGDWVNIRIVRDRAVLYALSPGTKELLYYAGRLVGSAYARRSNKKTDLNDALALYAKEVEARKIARAEIVSVNAEGATLRLHENATSYGMPNIHLKICAFDAGDQAGFFSGFTGQRVVSTETKCCANGDPYCEFDLRIIPTAEKAFAEAFRA